MKKKITEKDLRDSFKAGIELGKHIQSGNYFDKPLDEDEWIEDFFSEKKEEEPTIPITLGLIKLKCGWSNFCDVIGGNHYALKEWSVSDNEIFQVKESHAKQLGLI